MKNTLRSICPKIPKFDKISDFEGHGAPLSIKIFQNILHNYFFMKWHNLKESDLKLPKVDQIWTTIPFSIPLSLTS